MWRFCAWRSTIWSIHQKFSRRFCAFWPTIWSIHQKFSRRFCALRSTICSIHQKSSDSSNNAGSICLATIPELANAIIFFGWRIYSEREAIRLALLAISAACNSPLSPHQCSSRIPNFSVPSERQRSLCWNFFLSPTKFESITNCLASSTKTRISNNSPPTKQHFKPSLVPCFGLFFGKTFPNRPTVSFPGSCST